jgi:hypothetical protein
MAVEDKEAFLSRWSRLKRQQAAEERSPAAPSGGGAAQDVPAQKLPAVESLTPASDFAPFMQPKVAQALRRVALKKLFTDPHFNVPDPFEAYSVDLTGGDPIPEEMLKSLSHARSVMFREEDAARETQQAATPAQEPQADRAAGTEQPGAEDGSGRQDA